MPSLPAEGIDWECAASPDALNPAHRVGDVYHAQEATGAVSTAAHDSGNRKFGTPRTSRSSDATGSAASSTNTPRSHEATEFRAPTGWARVRRPRHRRHPARAQRLGGQPPGFSFILVTVVSAYLLLLGYARCGASPDVADAMGAVVQNAAGLRAGSTTKEESSLVSPAARTAASTIS